jgi:hypothetical protein
MRTLAQGLMSVGAIQMVEQLPLNETVNIISTIVISVVTLWRMLRKPKEVTTNTNLPYGKQ